MTNETKTQTGYCNNCHKPLYTMPAEHTCHSQDSKCEHKQEPCVEGDTDHTHCSKCGEPKPTEKDPVEKECNFGCEDPFYGKNNTCPVHNSENVQSWGERFAKEFCEISLFRGEDMHNRPPLYDTTDEDVSRIKQFISLEIQRAVESDRAEIVKKLHKVAMFDNGSEPKFAVKDILDLLK